MLDNFPQPPRSAAVASEKLELRRESVRSQKATHPGKLCGQKLAPDRRQVTADRWRADAKLDPTYAGYDADHSSQIPVRSRSSISRPGLAVAADIAAPAVLRSVRVDGRHGHVGAV